MTPAVPDPESPLSRSPSGVRAYPPAARLAAAATLLACLVAVVSLALAIRSPTDGAHINRGAALWSSDDRLSVDPSESAAIPVDSVVLSAAGHSLPWWVTRRTAGWLGGDRPPRAVAADGTLTSVIVRPGAAAEPVTVPLRRPSAVALLTRHWPALVFALIQLGVGLFVLRRLPDAPVARAMLAAGGITVACLPNWVCGITVSDLVQGSGMVRWWLGAVAFGLAWGALAHFALCFPRPLASAWAARWAIPAAYVAPFAAHAALALVVTVTGADEAERVRVWAGPAPVELWAVPLAVLAVFLAKAWTTQDRAGRTQLGLVAAAVTASLVAYVAFGEMPAHPDGAPLLSSELHPLLVLPIPLAAAAAVLRPRALEIDVLVNRVLVWGTLLIVLTMAYAASVGLLRAAAPLPGGASPSVVAAVIVAGASMLGLRPSRTLAQRLVDRAFYGQRTQPYRALAGLVRRIEEAVTPGGALPAAVETVAQALRLPYAAVESLDGDVVSWPAGASAPADLDRLPLVHQGRVVGQLAVASRDPRRGLTSADRELLDDLSRSLSGAVHTLALSRALQRSRERLVVAREEERHRIHHDLHDGLGPTLAGIALQLELSLTRLPEGDQLVGPTLERLLADTQAAIVEVRRLVYGLRPPAVLELGLAAALREKARAFTTGPDGSAPVRFTVRGPELPPLPPAVQVAAYRIAVEAMTNAVRHAGARRCVIELVAQAGSLEVSVTDDGSGPPRPWTPGVGITSMMERAAELGGSCDVTGDHRGTRVRARIPLLPAPGQATRDWPGTSNGALGEGRDST